MSGERGPISIEAVSRSMVLADNIKLSGLIGEKSGSQADAAEQKAQELLKSKFLPSSYESVTQIKEIVDSPSSSSSEIQKINAKKALADLGSALIIADPKLLDKIGQIDVNLPPSFRGISEEVFKNWFVGGPDDKVGKSLVTSLSEVEAFNLKVKRAPNVYGPKRAQVVEGQMDVMMGMFDSVEENSLEGLKIGAVVGYLDEMVKVSAPEGAVNGLDAVVDKLSTAVDKIGGLGRSGGGRGKPVLNPETGALEGYESPYDLKKNKLADAIKDMQGARDIRWNDYLTYDFYEKMSEDEQYRLSLMVMISGIAGNLKSEKDLERILGSKEAFEFISEHMNFLFNHDFKLVMSRMLNDLGEIYMDQNGNNCFRYKEVETVKDGVKGMDIHPDVKKKIDHIRGYEDELALFLVDQNGHWLVYKEDEKDDLGNVIHKSGDFIKGNDGKNIPDPEHFWLDRTTAYTAWNMFFGLGDSSMADRLRVLPTLGGVISDQLRTLNPESKALGKWLVLLKGVPVNNKLEIALKKSELFAGKLGKGVVSRLKLEYRYGVANKKKGEWPIDGKKTFRQKIIEGDLKFMSHKMFYGFLDFVNGGRDLYKVDDNGSVIINSKGDEENFYKDGGEKVTLASMLYDYAFEDQKESNGKPKLDSQNTKIRVLKSVDKIKPSFSFGSKQVTFMNEYRDSMEGAVLSYMNLTGKAEIKDPKDWIMKFTDKLGMINGIGFNGRPAFSYTSDPYFWRDVLIGAFGYDESRLSTDYFCLKLPDLRSGEQHPPYNLYLYDLLTNNLGFSNFDFDINKLMRLLGVSVSANASPDGPLVTTVNSIKEKDERNFTRTFMEMLRKAENKNTGQNDEFLKISDLQNKVKDLTVDAGASAEFKRVKSDFNRAAERNLTSIASDLYLELVRLSS